MPATQVLEPAIPLGLQRGSGMFSSQLPEPCWAIEPQSGDCGRRRGSDAAPSGDYSGSQNNLRVPNELGSQRLPSGGGGHTAEVPGFSFLRAVTSCVTGSSRTMWPGPRVSSKVRLAEPVQINNTSRRQETIPTLLPVLFRTLRVKSHIQI